MGSMNIKSEKASVYGADAAGIEPGQAACMDGTAAVDTGTGQAVDTRTVEKARAGDKEAFARLYSTVYRDMYRYALYQLGSPEDAENAVSDAVIDAYRTVGRLRDAEAFRGWIFRILYNKCARIMKSYMEERGSAVSVDAMSEYLPDGRDEIDEKLSEVMVREAFTVLSSEEKQIVTGHVYAGYTSREIAELMNMNHNTVRTKYRRALDKMRCHLTKGGCDHE